MTAPAVIAVDPADRAAWLEQRRQGLGSSDIAAIFGMDRFQSPMAVWLNKVERVEQEDTPAMLWGRRLEAAIADEFADRHTAHLWKPTVMYAHADLPILQANPDRLIGMLPGLTDPAHAVAELECKTSRLDDEWADDVPPDRVVIQVQHQLLVLDIDRAIVAVLLHGRTYREFTIHRDPAIGELIVEHAADFWKLVEQRTPPPVDASPSTTDALKSLYSTWEPASEIELGPAGAVYVEELRRAKQAQQEVNEEIARAENNLRALMGHHEIGLVAGEKAITWKGHTRKGLNQRALAEAHPAVFAEFCEESEVRPLRLAARKKENAA